MEANEIINHVQSFTGKDKEGVFPVDAFPKKIQEILLQTNKCLNFPVEITATSILFAASVSIGNTHNVKVMNGWNESVILYAIIMGRSGTMKSPPLKWPLKSIFDRDEENTLTYKADSRKWKNDIKNEEKADTPKPEIKKHLTSDFTPEALIRRHTANPRGLGVYADEIQAFLKGQSLYRESSNGEFWLSNHSNNPISVDRVSQEPEMIRKPCISVIGTMQRKIINELKKDNRADNGTIDRFLFVFLENENKPYWSKYQLPEHISETYKEIINTLLEIPLNMENGKVSPIIAEFSETSFEILEKWQNKNADLVNDAYSDALAGIYTKLEIYCIRFALILELLSIACGESDNTPLLTINTEIKELYRKASLKVHPDKNPKPDAKERFQALQAAYEAQDKEKVYSIYRAAYRPIVGVTAVNNAIRLTEYFRVNAKKAIALLEGDPLGALTEQKKKIYSLLPSEFTTDKAVNVAIDNGFSERSMKYFLNERTYFKRLKQGEYGKLF